MVVGLVLEHEEPVLILPVHIHLDAHGTGVYLLGFIQILELALRLELTGTDGGNIHQSNRLVLSAKSLPCIYVGVIALPDVICFYIHIVYLCKECGVTAVIGPVCVDHAHFGNGGITLFRISEIVTAEPQIIKIHGKAVLFEEVSKLCIIHGGKSQQCLNGGGYIVLHRQCVHRFKGCFP